MVSVLTLYSDNSSLNPAKVFDFYCAKLNENKRKRDRGWPILKIKQNNIEKVSELNFTGT